MSNNKSQNSQKFTKTQLKNADSHQIPLSFWKY